MLGIITAMEIELTLIREAMEDVTEESIGSYKFYLGKLNGCDTVCAVCGIGKVFAAMCTQTMIIRYSPDLIVNTGVGGTLSPTLSIGDIAIATAVCQHDMNTTALGDERGLISGINKVYFETSLSAVEKIEKIAKGMGLNTCKGTIASGDIFVSESKMKDKIHSEFSAIACEMEGAAIGQVSFVNNVPFAVIRAISDNADGSACDDYPSFAAASAKNSAAIVCKLASEM